MHEEEERIFFGEELEAIQQTYIKTSYGNIFAQAVGKPGQPLIIVVHGSGPKNSSDEYLYMLHEYLVRVSYLEKFFVVGIDCPGYGRSKGSKEAIKTFPLQMFREILDSLKYNSYFAMLGHSQGGAAIFNAVYEQPTLTEFMLMDRPVCGNIKRFNKFPVPTLLIYDIEDDGHPIWQGKLLFKELLKSDFYTYRASKDPYYVPDNLWNLILSFFQKYTKDRNSRNTFTRAANRSRVPYRSESPVIKDRSRSGTKKSNKVRPINYSMDKCEQIKKEKSEQENQLAAVKEVDKSQLYSMIADLQEMEDLPLDFNQPKFEYESPQELKRQDQLKKNLEEENFMKKIESKQASKKQEDKQQNSQQVEKNQGKNKPEQKKQPEDKKNLKRQQNEDYNCSICFQTLYHPVQTNCKHIFCKKCLGESYLVNQKCPLCRAQITKRTFKQTLHNRLFQKMNEQERKKRQTELHKFEQMLKSIIYVEIGNTSRELPTKQSHFSKTKKKYVWELFAKEPKNIKFEEVSFNINMGNDESRPVKVTSPPYVFESRSTFSFSCQINIKLRSKQYAPLTAIYRIDIAPGTHSKLIAIKKKNA